MDGQRVCNILEARLRQTNSKGSARLVWTENTYRVQIKRQLRCGKVKDLGLLLKEMRYHSLKGFNRGERPEQSRLAKAFTEKEVERNHVARPVTMLLHYSWMQ